MGSGQSSEKGPVKVPEFPPGVDGQLLQREAVQTRDLLVPIKMSSHYFTTGLESSLDDLKQVIVAQAREGFKLAAVYLPMHSEGITLDNEQQHTFSSDYTTRILCIFQTAPQHRGIVQDVVFHQSVMTLTQTFKTFILIRTLINIMLLSLEELVQISKRIILFKLIKIFLLNFSPKKNLYKFLLNIQIFSFIGSSRLKIFF